MRAAPWKPISQADRALLASLVSRLACQFWHERNDGSGLRFLAGAAATIRVSGGRMTVRLRPQAAGPVEPHRQALISAGVLVLDEGELVIGRLPVGREVNQFRDLAGLGAAWGNPARSA